MNKEQTGNKRRRALLIAGCCVLAVALGLGIAALAGAFGRSKDPDPSASESTAPVTVAPTESQTPVEPTQEPVPESSREPDDDKNNEDGSPDFTPGDWDNNTALESLPSIAQGTDGWWFLEGTSPDDVSVLTKMNADGTAYLSETAEGLEIKRDFVHPGAEMDAIYRWIAGADQDGLDLEGTYVKFGHQDSNPDWPDGVTLRIWHNEKLLFEKKVTAFAGDGNDNVVAFSFPGLTVKAGDAFTFQICADENNAWDGGRLSVHFGDGTVPQPDIDQVEPDQNRTNSTGIPERFNGKQGYDGWYYGYCEWDSKNFTLLPYEAANERYYNGGKPELKKDFVEPGNGKNAAYKWIVAQDGAISVKGEYVKFANNEDPNADGTCVRIFLNGVEKKWMGSNTMGNFAEERSEQFDETYTVKAGDELIFAVNPEGNDSWDGGRLTITIRPTSVTPAPAPGPEPAPEAGRENRTVLVEDFSGTQGKNGWYYGTSDWDSKNFAILGYEAQNERYYNNGKPELKKDFVEPGNGRNAAYKWIVAKDGKIRVYGEYVKFANSEDPNADGTCSRIFLNGEEKKWMGALGNYKTEQKLYFDEVFTVKAGDALMFTVDPEKNDSWDGGRLSVTIVPADDAAPGADKTALGTAIDAANALDETDYMEASWKAVADALKNAENVRQNPNATQEEVDAAKNALNAAIDALVEKPVEPQPERTNNTVLLNDFSGTQGKNGWYYGTCDWDGKNFKKLAYDEENERYFNNGKPELKKDFVEPGNGRNAAYKWVVAQNGKISVKGEYVKFANSEDSAADGTCVRIFINGAEVKWMGDNTKGNFAEEHSEQFDETYTVKAGDEVMFAVDPEKNDSWDGGRFSITISAVEEGGGPAPGTDPADEVNKSALKEAIDAAKALNADDYTEETWNAVNDALLDAENIYQDPEATQEEVDAAKNALNAAIDALEEKPVDPQTERTNNTVLLNDFSGTQGKNGWYYGACDWDGKNFAELAYD
ncbi:MAG: FIVAR domain-containing protein, partial [Lachnospiraceae bacterium]|nr:FIVAR domain-containing protein [Lachnospiraceae bacterium]